MMRALIILFLTIALHAMTTTHGRLEAQSQLNQCTIIAVAWILNSDDSTNHTIQGHEKNKSCNNLYYYLVVSFIMKNQCSRMNRGRTIELCVIRLSRIMEEITCQLLLR
jgi:hypothetical protein